MCCTESQLINHVLFCLLLFQISNFVGVAWRCAMAVLVFLVCLAVFWGQEGTGASPIGYLSAGSFIIYIGFISMFRFNVTTSEEPAL